MTFSFEVSVSTKTIISLSFPDRISSNVRITGWGQESPLASTVVVIFYLL
jgi:hypothetical protein